MRPLVPVLILSVGATLGASAQTSKPLGSTTECPCGRSMVNGGYYRVGDGVSAPRLISSTKPKYTEEARQANVHGTVVLLVFVERNGCVSAVRVKHPLGAGLDEQAVNTVRCWKFEPAMKDGQPVQVQIVVEIPFPPVNKAQ